MAPKGRAAPLFFLGVVRSGFQLDDRFPYPWLAQVTVAKLYKSAAAIKDIEETVLGHLEQHLAHFAVDFHVGKGHVFTAV